MDKRAVETAKIVDEYRARVLRRNCITKEACCSGNAPLELFPQRPSRPSRNKLAAAALAGEIIIARGFTLTGPLEPRNAVLTPVDETMIVAFADGRFYRAMTSTRMSSGVTAAEKAGLAYFPRRSLLSD